MLEDMGVPLINWIRQIIPQSTLHTLLAKQHFLRFYEARFTSIEPSASCVTSKP